MAVEHRIRLWGVEINDTLLHRLERGLAWAVIATVFFLPTSEALKNIFYVVSLVLYVAVIFAGRERITVPVVGWIFLSFLAAAVMSASVSPYPGKAITGVWGVFRYTSFFFIVERGVREERYVRTALWAAVVSFGFTALVTILRYFHHTVVLGGPHHIDALSLGGIDYAALHSVMTLALIFGMYVHTNVAGWRLTLLITIACLSVVLLGITHTRMLWGGLILIGLVLGWLRSARVAVMGVAISLLIVLGVGIVTPEVRSQIVSLGRIETYTTVGGGGVRAELWRKAIAMWRDAPWLGIGPKAFSHHEDVADNPERTKYHARQGHAHNLWLQTAVEMGSVGLVILVATFGYIGVWLFRSRGRFALSWPAAVWDGAFGSWLAILMAGLTEPSFGRENAMFFFMLLALVQTKLELGKGGPTVTEGREA